MKNGDVIMEDAVKGVEKFLLSGYFLEVEKS